MNECSTCMYRDKNRIDLPCVTCCNAYKNYYEKSPIKFGDWWDKIGSGIMPRIDDDLESHAKRVAFLAWCYAKNNLLKE